MKPKVHVLRSPWQKMRGAIGTQSLGESVLVFPYRKEGTRLFHTFGCPPLRIIGIDENGNITFDEVVPPNRFVRIPRAQIVLEFEPGADLEIDITEIRERCAIYPLGGGWGGNDPYLSIFAYALRDAFAEINDPYLSMFAYALRDAFAEIKAFAEPGTLANTDYHERMRMIDAAGFLIDVGTQHMNLPAHVWQIALNVWQQVKPAERAEYLLAAEYETPWLKENFPCARCGNKGRWRQVIITTTLEQADEWRYNRPENHAPLCRRCAYALRWNVRIDIRYQVARILWGERFTALLRWHRARRHGRLPSYWNKAEYPLWPPEFGGDTWETGSGHVEHATPKKPRINAETRRRIRALGPERQQKVVFKRRENVA